MSGAAVLELIDAAPVFTETAIAAPQPLTGEDLRRAGLADLDQLLAHLRAHSEGDRRAVVLAEVAEQVGTIIGAGALNEAFAKAALEDAAAGIGLIRDLGAKAVKAAIGAGIKLGKKTPREFLAQDAFQSQPRPGAPGAGNSAAVRISSSPDARFPGDIDPPAHQDAPPGEAGSAPAAAPPPPSQRSETNASSQTGGSSEADAAAGEGGAGDVPPDAPDEDDDARNMRLAFFPLTDLGNAERFHARFKGKLLFNTALATTSPGRRVGLAPSGGGRITSAHAFAGSADQPRRPSAGRGDVHGRARRRRGGFLARGRMSSWPGPHEAMLREHFNAGLSYSVIAGEINREFGTAYSKNACIGRGARMGLGKRVTRKLAPKPKREPAPKEGAQRPDIAIRKAATAPKIGAPHKPKPNPIKPGEVRLIELTADTCRWPSGDRPEDVRYCGLKPVDGSPYCETHTRTARRSS